MEVDLGDGRGLRGLEDDDAEELFALIDSNRIHLAHWMPFVGQTRGVVDSLAFIRAAHRQFEENRGMQLAVTSDARIIGVAGFHAIDWNRRCTSIGYWLAAEAQGTGAMTAAVSALLDYAFAQWKLARVEIRAGVTNARSRAIPERLGFTDEGILPAAERIGTRIIDHAIYAMTAEEWKSARESAQPPVN
ncbi:MAG TPA: GNAT family protein [Solirubrobacteraceae bacterium]|jgi:ribosomal-protein-serine acetyltransferase